MAIRVASRAADSIHLQQPLASFLRCMLRPDSVGLTAHTAFSSPPSTTHKNPRRTKMIKIIQFFTEKFYFRGLPNILFRLRRFLIETSGIVRDPNGIHFRIDRNNYFQHNITYGYYEAEVRWTLKLLLKPGDTFLDIGANIGYLSAVASECVGETGHVLSFEPNPEVFPLLVDNSKLGPYRNIFPVNFAASEKSGTANLFCGFETALSTLQEKTGLLRIKCAVEVATVSIDDWLRTQVFDIGKIKLVKIDTEGHEYKVLKGLEKLIRSRTAAFLIENNPIASKTIGVEFDMICKDFFFVNNYSVYWIGSKGSGGLFHRRKLRFTPVTLQNATGFNGRSGDYLCLADSSILAKGLV